MVPPVGRQLVGTRAAAAAPVLLCLALVACGAPAWKPPVPAEEVGFLSRAKTIERGDFTVTVAVPSDEETERLFGTALYDERIQPVWIEVHNRSGSEVHLMKVGVDEQHFSPLETAYQRHSGTDETRHEMDLFFHLSAFANPVPAGGSRKGYVFTNLDEGAKAVNVDLVGDGLVESFSLVLTVPGLLTDVAQVKLDQIFEEWIDLETPEDLRAALAAMPCCTTNREGDRNGDPLNVVLVGDRSFLFSALIRRGWHQTEITYGASAWKTTKSFLFGTRYLYSPISPLYVFGRPQDIGVQKARDSIHLRNHMRLWLTPYRYQGEEVFVGQISRDIGVKFSWRTITTHAIDPDVDETRDALVGDMAYSQAMHSFAYVAGSQPSTLDHTFYNLTPDPYYSDGLRAVMFFGERPHGLDSIRRLPWETRGRPVAGD